MASERKEKIELDLDLFTPGANQTVPFNFINQTCVPHQGHF